MRYITEHAIGSVRKQLDINLVLQKLRLDPLWNFFGFY